MGTIKGGNVCKKSSKILVMPITLGWDSLPDSKGMMGMII